MKELQDKIKKFCKDNNLESPIEHRFIDLMSELGELSKEVLKMSNYGRKKLEYRNEFKEEIWDVFYSLINLANCFDIDLEESLNCVLKKYEKRLAKWWIWSENK